MVEEGRNYNNGKLVKFAEVILLAGGINTAVFYFLGTTIITGISMAFLDAIVFGIIFNRTKGKA